MTVRGEPISKSGATIREAFDAWTDLLALVHLDDDLAATAAWDRFAAAMDVLAERWIEYRPPRKEYR